MAGFQAFGRGRISAFANNRNVAETLDSVLQFVTELRHYSKGGVFRCLFAVGLVDEAA